MSLFRRSIGDAEPLSFCEFFSETSPLEFWNSPLGELDMFFQEDASGFFGGISRNFDGVSEEEAEIVSALRYMIGDVGSDSKMKILGRLVPQPEKHKSKS